MDGEFEFVAHDSSPQFGSLNYGSPAKRNASGPLLVRRLRAGADINQSSISDKCPKMTPLADMFKLPPFGERIRSHEPVCTARSLDRVACYEAVPR